MQQIADEFDCSISLVSNRIDFMTRRVAAESVDELRAKQAVQLEHLLQRMWPGVMRGDPAVASVVLRAFERQAKLFGLDAPERVSVAIIEEHDVVPGEVVSDVGEGLRELPSAP